MRNISRVLLMAMVIGLFIIRPVSSYADWNGHDGHGNGGNWHGNNGGGHGHDRSFIGVNLSIWPDSYYYGAPYYPYYPADAVLVSPPVDVQPVTVVQSPTVVVDQAGPAPVITTVSAASDTGDSFTINIPNNKGGYTAVTLKKSGSGFIGPQGEFYPEFPKVFQLEVIYGK